MNNFRLGVRSRRSLEKERASTLKRESRKLYQSRIKGWINRLWHLQIEIKSVIWKLEVGVVLKLNYIKYSQKIELKIFSKFLILILL